MFNDFLVEKSGSKLNFQAVCMIFLKDYLVADILRNRKFLKLTKQCILMWFLSQESHFLRQKEQALTEVYKNFNCPIPVNLKKSCIRETKHCSTDTDSSTTTASKKIPITDIAIHRLNQSRGQII